MQVLFGLLLAASLLATGWAALPGRPQRLYPSAAAHHLEPVTRVSLRHREVHLASSDRERRLVNGVYRPLPDAVRLSFSAYNRSHSYDLEVVHDLFAPGSSTVTHDPTSGAELRLPHRLATYQAKLSNGWVVATFHDDGTFQAVVALEDELLQVDPLPLHEAELHPSTFGALSMAAAHKMVAFRLEDLRDGPEYRRECGAVTPPKAKGRKGGGASHRHATAASSSAAYPLPPLNSRKLLALVRWTNCYPNDHLARKLFVGVATDLGYYKRLGGSVENVQNSIAQIFAACNNIYSAQLNVYLQVADQIINQAPGSYPWNEDRTAATCPEIQALLETFTEWRLTSKPHAQGIWHLLTDCYPPPGAVGLAWVGSLCSSEWGAGLSSYSPSTWLTVAHEIGHNFGAAHTFQEGEGETGGIMDYGDGKLNGEYQFHTTYSKAEMCTAITNSMAANRYGLTPLAACWAFYAPECGNGVVEEGEECDDTSDCCDRCQLVASAQCSGGPCCDAQCKYKTTNVTCKVDADVTGYCANGACIASACERFGMAYCGTKPANPCRQNCVYEDVCTDMDGFTTEDGDPFNGIADGEVCSTEPYSTCDASGNCVSWSASYGWHTGPWDDCSQPCGSGIQNRTVHCVETGERVVQTDETRCEDPRPAASRACNTVACPDYVWRTGNWSQCPVTCDGGTQTRAVWCEDRSTLPATTVYETLCTGDKPNATLPCNTAPCPRLIVTGPPLVVNRSPVLFNITTSQPAELHDETALQPSGLPGLFVGNVTGGPVRWVVVVYGASGVGTIFLTALAGAFRSDPGRLSLPAGPAIVEFDSVPPVCSVSATTGSPAYTQPLLFSVSCTEPVTGLRADGFEIAGSNTLDVPYTLSLTGSGKQFVLSVSGATAAGPIVVALKAGAVHDAAGNPNPASAAATITFALRGILRLALTVPPTNGLATRPISELAVTFEEPVVLLETGGVEVITAAVVGQEQPQVRYRASPASWALNSQGTWARLALPSAVFSRPGAKYVVRIAADSFAAAGARGARNVLSAFNVTTAPGLSEDDRRNPGAVVQIIITLQASGASVGSTLSASLLQHVAAALEVEPERLQMLKHSSEGGRSTVVIEILPAAAAESVEAKSPQALGEELKALASDPHSAWYQADNTELRTLLSSSEIAVQPVDGEEGEDTDLLRRVIIAAAAVLVLLVLCYCWLRRRRRKASAATVAPLPARAAVRSTSSPAHQLARVI